MRRRVYAIVLFVVTPLLSLVSALPVSSAPLQQVTNTALPTETVAPTLTPYIPSVCEATSVIPTSPPFYTPTLSLPTVTGTLPTATVTNTVTPTPTVAGGCDLFTLGTVAFAYAELGVDGNTVSSTGGCYVQGAVGFCDLTIQFQRNSNFWGGSTGVIYHVPVIGLAPSQSLTMYYHEEDTFYWQQGELYNVSRLGFTDSAGCPFGWDNGVGGDSQCTVRTDLENPGVLVKCGGAGILYVWQSCHIVFDFTFGGEYCFLLPTPSPTPSCNQVGGEVVPSDPIAWFNPPTKSLQGCYVIYDPITVPLPSLSWSPFDLPSSFSVAGFQICIWLLTFSAYFAGVEWSLVLGVIASSFAIVSIYTVLRDQ